MADPAFGWSPVSEGGMWQAIMGGTGGVETAPGSQSGATTTTSGSADYVDAYIWEVD